MPQPSPRYVRHRTVREERVDDLLFLIDEEGKAIHALAPTSAGIWSLLAVPVSVAEAKRIMKQAFPGVSPKRIARDVDAVFEDLRTFGLIENAG